MKDEIYKSAKVDAHTKSIPTRDTDNTYHPSCGQKKIYNSSDNDFLRGYFSQLRFLKAKRDDLLNQMLSKQIPLDSDLSKTDDEIKKLQGEIDELIASIKIEKEAISVEEEGLLVRGFSLPKESNNEVALKEVQIDKSLFQKKKLKWKRIKKWISVFSVIILLELFFGLALWDSMRDSKSVIQMILRIASSGILITTIHLAEIKYKEHGRKIYAIYITYGIISLVILLIGSLILGYFFPEYLHSGNLSADVFDLSNVENYQNSRPKTSFVEFFMRYDFIIGVLSLIIYMLISFLDNSKRIEKQNNDKDLKQDKDLLNSDDLTTVQLKYMYSNLSSSEKDLLLLKNKMEYLNNTPSSLLNDISILLREIKEEIEINDKNIDDLENITELQFRKIEENLQQYQVDFIDAFKNKPDSLFTNLVWPNRQDIKQYFNII